MSIKTLLLSATACTFVATTAFAGGLAPAAMEDDPFVPVADVQTGSLNAGTVLAGLAAIAIIAAVAGDDDDDDDDSAPTTPE